MDVDAGLGGEECLAIATAAEGGDGFFGGFTEEWDFDDFGGAEVESEEMPLVYPGDEGDGFPVGREEGLIGKE